MMVNARPLSDFAYTGVDQLIDSARALFDERDCWDIRVPARLCLVADHTDYWAVSYTHLTLPTIYSV